MRHNRYLDEIEQIIREIRIYEGYEQTLIRTLTELRNAYLAKKLSPLDYEHRKSIALDGQTKQARLNFYRSYRYSLLKQVERLTTDLFESVYSDERKPLRSKQLPVVEAAPRPAPATPKPITAAQLLPRLNLHVPRFGSFPQLIPKRRPKRHVSHLFKHPLTFNFSPTDATKEIEASWHKLRPKKETSTIFGETTTGEELKESPVSFSLQSPRHIFRVFMKRFQGKQEPIVSDKTVVPQEMKKLRQMREKLYAQERSRVVDSTLLVQEARHVHRLMNVDKRNSYRGNAVGVVANVTVRRVSLYLVNKFPALFGKLYNELRAANVQVLSNTYVNIMVLATLVVGGAGLVLFPLIFAFTGQPLQSIVVRTIVFSLGASIATAATFFFYPSMRIRDRRRKTTVNLPFAINHMAAVATSGVPPSTMFSLIASYGEYEDVSTEVRKIVDYMNIFGYDLLTAIKTVANITPSPVFKKFLEGMVSTVETGGDLVNYLKQESEQASLTYKLERQRYNETVSTYSDIYTGVLIAAPLFFVSALALVNLLGGELAGFSVGVVLAVGAYIIIPVLNMAFLAFLQFTQPEV